jgi:hypothetical protein
MIGIACFTPRAQIFQRERYAGLLQRAALLSAENPGIAGSKFPMKSERRLAHVRATQRRRVKAALAQIVNKIAAYSGSLTRCVAEGKSMFQAPRAANRRAAH